MMRDERRWWGMCVVCVCVGWGGGELVGSRVVVVCYVVYMYDGFLEEKREDKKKKLYRRQEQQRQQQK